jgi:hypothetical protein
VVPNCNLCTWCIQNTHLSANVYWICYKTGIESKYINIAICINISQYIILFLLLAFNTAYSRRCGTRKLYSAFKSCYITNGGIDECFPILHKQGLITYQRYGRGYGLGVTFVKKGIVYGKSCKYMIILIFSYKQILWNAWVDKSFPTNGVYFNIFISHMFA